MKTSDVMVGATYLTKIGDALVRVVVLSRHEPDSYHKRATFTVRRADFTNTLPKRRTAAALRPIT